MEKEITKKPMTDEEKKKRAEEFIKTVDSKIHKREKHVWMIRDYDRYKNQQD